MPEEIDVYEPTEELVQDDEQYRHELTQELIND